MKGGITSGVVYPKAVVTLAQQFRLKNIGGTSAGAIAAAAAAAAEFAKQTGAETGGYDLLAKLPELLGTKNGSGHTNLFTFFQPQEKTAPFFRILTGALETNGWKAALLKLVGRAGIVFLPWTLLGLGFGLGLSALEFSHGYWLPAILWLVLGVIASALTAVIAFIVSFGSNVTGAEGNYFGLCTGMSTDPADDHARGPSRNGQSLTIWLTKYLNELAGLDPDGDPLTFGQLWGLNKKPGENPGQGEKAINLEMFTTCLSKGRPFRLPFRDEEAVRENVCYFHGEEMRNFFPDNVVDWMIANPRAVRYEKTLPPGFHRMPEPWNLPIVVATRMSLSFPILLSAVRLWAHAPDFKIKDPNGEAGASTDDAESTKEFSLAPCWFSDGGLCSNFPIHLFDAPLPRWPTFGINLVDKPETTPLEELANPWMPANNNQGIREPLSPVGEGGGLAGLGNFLVTIVETMQEWQDNTLSRMPGYRDRIAAVGLRPSEGGLNLNMPKERIDTLVQRGDAAAREFVERFSDLETRKGAMNWPNHRWIRFRSLMAALEEMLQRMHTACEKPQPGDAAYDVWVQSIKMGEAPSYQWVSEEQRKLVLETLERLKDLAKEWEAAETLAAETSAPGASAAKVSASAGAPRPRPELRPRPRI
jgi:predicted acylesterase/phospholipase RssA